jgi:hypothetical protein
VTLAENKEKEIPSLAGCCRKETSCSFFFYGIGNKLLDACFLLGEGRGRHLLVSQEVAE